MLLIGSQDVTEQNTTATTSGASYSNVLGVLAQVRKYVLSDQAGNLTPFSTNGYFALNNWRDVTVDETQEGTSVFKGAVFEIAQTINRGRRDLEIEAREPLAGFLSWPVEASQVFEQNTLTGVSKFTVNGSHSIGDTTIDIVYDGVPAAAAEVEVSALVAFTDSLVPRYQVIAVTNTGSPSRTTQITLDRGLEVALSNGQQITFTIPVTRSGPAEIFNALTAVGLGNRLGTTFTTLDAADAAAGYTLRLNILQEDGITLAAHLAKICELTDLYLTVNAAGVIDILRGLQWTGNDLDENITGAELIDPVRLQYDTSALIIGYDLLYKTGETVKVASGDVDQTVIDQWVGINRWQPIEASATSVSAYKYLYSSATSADYFGGRRLDYYGVPRVNISATLKRNFTGTVRPIEIQLFSEFGLSFPTARNQFFIGEPARVIAYQYDNRTYKWQVTFQLTNFPSPNVPRDVEYPSTPVVNALAATSHGFSADFAPIGIDLYCAVYLADAVTQVISQQLLYTADEDSIFTTLQNTAVMQNGSTYYVEFWTSTGGIQSPRTARTAFTPNEIDAEWDTAGTGWGVGVWSA